MPRAGDQKYLKVHRPSRFTSGIRQDQPVTDQNADLKGIAVAIKKGWAEYVWRKPVLRSCMVCGRPVQLDREYDYRRCDRCRKRLE
jgi:hypothetical protein